MGGLTLKSASNRDVTCQVACVASVSARVRREKLDWKRLLRRLHVRFLFLIVTDWVMRRTFGHGESCIRWKFASKLDDLDFADVVLISSTKQEIQEKQQ